MRPDQSKRVNEMDRLGDLGRFPLPVLAGAVINILITTGLVWHYQPRAQFHFLGLEKWIAGVLAFNLIPVALLRLLTLNGKTEYPVIERMNFFRDQHKFSNWVYLAASANMAVWILVTWDTSWTVHSHTNIAIVMLVAVVTSLAPAWLRLFQR